MDSGTDAADILNNKVIPLKRGYIAVVGRNQAEVANNVSVRDGLLKENQYFMSRSNYRSVSARCGTHNLAKILNQLLIKHIKDVLPDIKTKIADMINETDLNLAALGEGPAVHSPDKLGAYLLQLISGFTTTFVNILEVRPNMATVSISEVFGGARISYIFKELFGKKLSSHGALEGISDDDIRTTIMNSNGLRPSLMMHELAFDLLVRKQIARLEAPSLQCVDHVFDEMLRMTEQSSGPEMKRFPALNDRIREIVLSHLKKFLAPAQNMISSLIQIELGFLNTSHPDFISGKHAVSEAQRRLAASAATLSPVPSTENKTMAVDQLPHIPSSSAGTVSGVAAQGVSSGTPVKSLGVVGFAQMFTGSWQTPATSVAGLPSEAGPSHPSQKQSGSVLTSSNPLAIKLNSVPEVIRISNTPSDRERLETEVIKILVESYFEIVKKNVIDLVPKVVMHLLVNSFRNSIQNQLVAELYSDLNSNAALLRENDDLAEQRSRYREIREMLSKAMEIVHEVRDYNNGFISS